MKVTGTPIISNELTGVVNFPTLQALADSDITVDDLNLTIKCKVEGWSDLTAIKNAGGNINLSLSDDNGGTKGVNNVFDSSTYDSANGMIVMKIGHVVTNGSVDMSNVSIEATPQYANFIGLPISISNLNRATVYGLQLETPEPDQYKFFFKFTGEQVADSKFKVEFINTSESYVTSHALVSSYDSSSKKYSVIINEEDMVPTLPLLFTLEITALDTDNVSTIGRTFSLSAGRGTPPVITDIQLNSADELVFDIDSKRSSTDYPNVDFFIECGATVIDVKSKTPTDLDMSAESTQTLKVTIPLSSLPTGSNDLDFEIYSMKAGIYSFKTSFPSYKIIPDDSTINTIEFSNDSLTITMGHSFTYPANREFEVSLGSDANLDVNSYPLTISDSATKVITIDVEDLPVGVVDGKLKLSIRGCVKSTQSFCSIAIDDQEIIFPTLTIKEDGIKVDSDKFVIPYSITEWTDVNALNSIASVDVTITGDSTDTIDVLVTSSTVIDNGHFLAEIDTASISSGLYNLDITMKPKYSDFIGTESSSAHFIGAKIETIDVRFSSASVINVDIGFIGMDDSDITNGTGFEVIVQDPTDSNFEVYKRFFDRSDVGYEVQLAEAGATSSLPDKFTVELKWEDIALDTLEEMIFIVQAKRSSTIFGESMTKTSVFRHSPISSFTVTQSTDDSFKFDVITGLTHDDLDTNSKDIAFVFVESGKVKLFSELSENGLQSDGNIIDAVIDFNDGYGDLIVEDELNVNVYVVENDNYGVGSTSYAIDLNPKLYVNSGQIDGKIFKIILQQTLDNDFYINNVSRDIVLIIGNDSDNVEYTLVESDFSDSVNGFEILIDNIDSTLSITTIGNINYKLKSLFDNGNSVLEVKTSTYNFEFEAITWVTADLKHDSISLTFTHVYWSFLNDIPDGVEFMIAFENEKVFVSKNELTEGEGGKFLAEVVLSDIMESTSKTGMKQMSIIGSLRFTNINVQSLESNGLDQMMIPPIDNLNIGLLSDGSGLDITFNHFLSTIVTDVSYEVKIDYNGHSFSSESLSSSTYGSSSSSASSSSGSSSSSASSSSSSSSGSSSSSASGSSSTSASSSNDSSSSPGSCISPQGCNVLYSDLSGLKDLYGAVSVSVTVVFATGERSSTIQATTKHVPAFAPSISLTQTSDNKLSVSGTSVWDTSSLLSDDLSLKIEFYDCGESESDTCISKKEFTEVTTSATDFVIDGQDLTWTFENTLHDSFMESLSKLKMVVHVVDNVASASISDKVHDFFKVLPILSLDSIISSAQDGITIIGSHYWFNTGFSDSKTNSPFINVKLSTSSNPNVMEKQFTVVHLGSNADSKMTINIPLNDLPSDLKDDVTIQVMPQISNPNPNYSYKTLNDETIRVRVCSSPSVYPTGLGLAQFSSTSPALDSEILLGCESGYQPTLDSIFGRTCVVDGHDWIWSGITPSCVLEKNKCDDITLGDHLNIVGKSFELGDDNKWKDGTKLIFGCEEGYRLVGSSKSECSDGLWSDMVPICKEENRTNNDKQCKPGTGVSSSGSHCVACQRGYYSTNGICKQCPLNWTSIDANGSVACIRI
eukprot:TRINITY_DN465_c1_g1_i1.p1 TRINITY_DN465_c1_g1~~TRINITY_DN465_c1_g1_i1.p1  ORF type:complete len:1840 (+),score=645.22 TRINITY_DN465_c1_g1_i1:824-5521(+)